MSRHVQKVFVVLVLLILCIFIGPHLARTQDVLSNSQWITAFYVSYWSRAPDLEGHAYWLGEFNQGRLTIPEIAENFALSDEAKAAYPYFNAPHAATQTQVGDFMRSVTATCSAGRLRPQMPASSTGWASCARAGPRRAR